MSKLPSPHPSSIPSTSSSNGATYELLAAQASTKTQSDPISWSSTRSYRRSPYRHLHHQGGIIGTYRIRLLEARDLTRSHWSVLGIGPVRHLGLSRAHGEVSSFVEFALGWDDDGGDDSGDGYYNDNGNDYRARNAAENDATSMGENGTAATTTSIHQHEHERHEEDGTGSMDTMDRKPAAVTTTAASSDLMSMSLRDAATISRRQLSNRQRGQQQQQQQHSDHDMDSDHDDDRKPPALHVTSNGTSTDTGNGSNGAAAAATPVESMHELDVEATTTTGNGSGIGSSSSGSSNIHRSSTVHQNSNPIWPTSQRDGNRSLFAIRLPKRRGGDNNGNATNNNNNSVHANTDGQRIKLRMTVREEMTGIENVLPDPFGLG
eukprot:CAMPEP_0178510740 /NCGR_PEP_ID=MMETSP0696-20121128/21995_1 /TAXON_ID=265572 /ORGANISM="Extubocellulus spinifer, Strain CCMP396" /LENGTH=376 /DNA_ID=CAMNT_0020140477 /DNA_START=56 /DNA_END=1182 /DNA_ORIENTATION=-